MKFKNSKQGSFSLSYKLHVVINPASIAIMVTEIRMCHRSYLIFRCRLSHTDPLRNSLRGYLRGLGVSHIAKHTSDCFSNININGQRYSKMNVVFRILNFHWDPFGIWGKQFQPKKQFFFYQYQQNSILSFSSLDTDRFFRFHLWFPW